ncbi:MAG: aminotransferase class IV [Sarcina sp.]
MKIIYENNQEKINIDTGYFFAKAIFETILVKNKGIFLKEHILRLNNSLKKFNINQRIELRVIEEFIVQKSLKDCVLKIVVSEKNIVATTRKINYKNEDYIKGFKLSISGVKRNTTSILPYIKSTSYIENLLEREKALADNKNEVLFLNEYNNIAECSTSNIFFVKDKKIFTPNVSCGLLNGIIRSWIIENYEVIEGDFTLDDLFKADEVFITNSVIGIMKVIKLVDNIYINSQISEKIRNKYLKVMEDM